MLLTGLFDRGDRRDVASHGMYRRRDDPRGRMISDITNDLRRYSVDAQHVGHAFAALHGLNATDLQALIAVMDAELAGDPITPGRLGEQLNLSSGSVTALIDRLERAGHIRRDRDTADRRKVFLHYADRGAALAKEFFQPLGTRTDQVMGRLQPRGTGGGPPVHDRDERLPARTPGRGPGRSSRAVPPGHGLTVVLDRLATRLASAALRLPAPRTRRVTVTRDIPVRVRDGVTLRTDHYAPDLPGAPTVLIRTPYGRGGPVRLLGRLPPNAGSTWSSSPAGARTARAGSSRRWCTSATTAWTPSTGCAGSAGGPGRSACSAPATRASCSGRSLPRRPTS